MVKSLCRTVFVSLCFVVALSQVPPACANTGPAAEQPLPAVADPVPLLRTLEPAAEPSLAPSPLPDVLIAPGRRARTASAQPAMGQVCLLTAWGYRVGPMLSYPARAATANAIQLMATHQVSTGRNRCARSVREALGWGLGDAHEWLSLTKRGFTRRPKGECAQPGDIVVWPFTFGSNGSQHIGIAVGTEDGPKLLSNMLGNMQVSRLAPGYVAFYKNVMPAAPSLIAPSTVLQLVCLPAPRVELRAAVTTVPTAMP